MVYNLYITYRTMILGKYKDFRYEMHFAGRNEANLCENIGPYLKHKWPRLFS